MYPCLTLFQGDKSASLDISTNDFTSPSFYPYDASKADAPPLVHGFISSNRIADLVSQLKLKIIQKLVPGLRKNGYTEEIEDASTSATPANPPPQPAPARPRPVAPPFPEGIPYVIPPDQRPYNPLEIGRRDLDPLGAAFTPPSLFAPRGGDGMYVGPNHPIFGSRGRERRPDDLRGPWGGDGFLPPLGAPPGARFDPIGPNPNPLRPTFGGWPRRGGINTGEPDNDEFMPPGAVR